MRMGIGRLLVHDVAVRAADAGATYVDVVANPNALGFYSRLGFEVTSQTSTRFGSATRMTLRIDIEAAEARGGMEACLSPHVDCR